MKNLTNKNLQRMRDLMGNKKPINESKIISSVELVKKSSEDKFYGIVKENKKYFIKESNDGSNFDFIGGVANKIKNQFESYEQAVRRLNLMLDDTNVLTPDIIEEKKFVIKTKKKKTEEPKSDGFGTETKEDSFDFGGEKEEETESGSDFDFGDEGEEETKGDFDFGDDESEKEEGAEGEEEFDFGGEESDKESSEEFDSEDEDEDYNLEDEGEDSIKSIQRMTGKLGQKLRDVEDLSSDTMKWVAKSVLSALDLEVMDSEDKKDLIRTIKKKKDEGSDEEVDFMGDEKVMSTPIITYMSDDMVDWDKLSDKEKSEVVNYRGDGEDMCSHCNGLGHDDMTGEECEWCAGTGVENMEDYMEDEDDMYGPGDGEVKTGEEILSDDDGCSYCGDRNKPYYGDEIEMGNYPGMEEDWMSEPEDEYDNVSVGQDSFMKDEDFMSRFAKNVKRAIPGRKMDEHEVENHLKKIQNKLGGANVVHIDDDKVVGDFGYVEVKPNGYVLHKEGSKFGKTFGFEELGKLQKSISGLEEDYMEDPYMMPQPAPSRPQTRPETPVKPGRPDTDRPSPSKKPFTPPPYIKPGEEPNPKAGDENYGTTEGMDYMKDDESMEICQVCQGRGYEKGNIGFKSQYNPCVTCTGTGKTSRVEVEDEVDEPFTENPFGFYTDDTMPPKVGFKYHYKERFQTPFNFNENKVNKKTIKEDHLNTKMASYEQEMAYEDVEDMAIEHGMEVEFCHKDRSKDPEEQTVYLDLMKNGKAVAQVRINSVGDVEMGSLKGKVFKGEPVDSHSDFDEVLEEKNIKTPMNPAPAPARPQIKPETPTKPAPTKPGTDKPSPSRKPFTPPPFIRPGEEPSPKAERKSYSYMDDDSKGPSNQGVPGPVKPSMGKPKKREITPPPSFKKPGSQFDKYGRRHDFS